VQGDPGGLPARIRRAVRIGVPEQAMKGAVMGVRRYFDLNEPVPIGRSSKPPLRALGGSAAVAPVQLPLAWQIATYVVLATSIVASRFLDLYRAGAVDTFSLDWRYMVFLGISSLLAFPVVYDKARANLDQPLLLKIVVIFSAGMGWEKIVSTAIGK
jgi:hypothetical protein